MQLFAIELDLENKIADIDILINCLSEEKQKRIRKFLKYEDVIRSLAGDIFIRSIILSKFSSISNNDIKFLTNEYGKPFVMKMEFINFNISHSGKWVVCAIDNNIVGVDVEEIANINLDMTKNIFKESEYNKLDNMGKEKLQYFYELWTLKESYVKAVGKGLSIAFNSFEIRDNEVDLITVDSEIGQFYFKKYDIDRNYKMSVCSSSNDFPEKVIIKKFEQVVDKFITLQ